MRILLITLMALIVTVPGISAGSASLAGDWDGTLDAGTVQLRLVLHVTAAGDKGYTATLDSVDQGANGISTEKVVFENNVLKFDVPAVHGSYQGTMDAQGRTLTGKWTQGASLPLTFRKRAAAKQTASSSPLDGAWQGLLVAGEQKLRIALQVTTGADGVPGVTFVSLDQGPASLSGKNVKFEGGLFSFDIPAVHGRYEGKLAEDKNVIHGTWTQGAALPLDFKRGTTPVAAGRPQQPLPPFPYRQEEVRYPGAASSGATLAGTFTKPEGPGPFPVVLLIPGSGPHDRDETVFGHKPFLVLADYLTRHGIAVLRYDDRGVGQSTGNFSSVTSRDLADDAAAGVRYLLTRPDVNKAHVGLIGHSEGGMLAPLAALGESAVAFTVLLAGSAVQGDQIVLEQQERIMAASGMPEAKRRELLNALAKVMELVREGKTAAGIETEAKKLLPGQPEMAGTLKSFDTPWFRYFISYDPKPALTKLKCPVLALYGEKDLQVPPDQNMPVMKAALQESGNADTTIQLLPGLNHLFQTCKTGSPAEYGSITETMSPLALETVERWIHHHVS